MDFRPSTFLLARTRPTGPVCRVRMGVRGRVQVIAQGNWMDPRDGDERPVRIKLGSIDVSHERVGLLVKVDDPCI